MALRAAPSRIVARMRSVGLERVGAPMVTHIEGKPWEMRPSAGNHAGRAIFVAISGNFRSFTPQNPIAT